ncbi:MAG: hypothetical protein H0T50_07205 [Gemmatimonadales bacterium]|nr:hypothetical protein [Gemmatimonadales bacterium]
MSTAESFSSIDGGGLHSCASAASGTAVCWGDNSVGQLGKGDDVGSPTPTPVQSGIQFVALELGDQHSCALGQDSQAYCWGDNGFGQLGTGALGSPSLTPVRVLAPVASSTAVYASMSRGQRPTPGYEARRRKWCASLQPRVRDRLGACHR